MTGDFVIRAYAERVEFWQDGKIVGQHIRAFGRDKAIYDPLHYIPVLARKPGALRNGAPFKEWELPPAIRRVQRKLASIRRVRRIHAFRSAEKDGAWLTMHEAAAKLGVTSHVVRRMIQDGILPAEQVVPGAPWQIRAEDLENDDVIKALRQKGRPRHTVSRDQLPMFPDT